MNLPFLLLEVLGIQIHRDSSHKTTGLLATGLVRVTTSWEFIGRASLFIVGVYLSCKFICRASLFIVRVYLHTTRKRSSRLGTVGVASQMLHEQYAIVEGKAYG